MRGWIDSVISINSFIHFEITNIARHIEMIKMPDEADIQAKETD